MLKIILFNSFSKTKPFFPEYFIRPSLSYPGGNYGNYGGYDIILIKLKESFKKLR